MAEVTGIQPRGTPLQISQLKSAQDLTKHVETLILGRKKMEREWKLNLAFYKGNQYAWYNPYSRRIETLPVEDGEKPRYRVRLVSNQIVSGAQSLLAKYTKTRPKLNATPGSGDDAALKAAQMSERLLEYWWDLFDLDAKLEEAVLWGIIAGQGFWKISWDDHAGTQMKFTLDPYGNPIVDDALKTEFRSQLQQLGVQPQEQIVYLGDLKIEVMSPFNVVLDPGAKVFEDCEYAYCVHYLTPDYIKAKWRAKVVPDSVPAPEDTTLPFDNAFDAHNRTLKKVYVGYFKPTISMPRGRYVVFTGGTNAQILEDSDWPYPSHELPLVKFPGIRVPGQVYDDAIVSHARPLQKELNRTLSQIVEYKNLMVRPRVWAPVGSLRTKLTTEAGAAYEYVPINGMKPEPEQLPTMPPYVFNHLEDISKRLADIFGLTEVTQGTVPPNVEAGIAIDLLQEMAADRLAPTIKLMENALARAGNQMLKLAQVYYKEPRLLKIKGSGGNIQVKKFTQADISGGIDVTADVGSGLPRTRAGRQALILNLVQNNIVPLDKAWKHLDIADLKGLTAPFAAHEDKALREHEKIIQGIPLNPAAVAEAQNALQQGMNPETQQPLSGDPNEVQQILTNASLKPAVGENYQIHIDTHTFFMTSVEFESLPVDVQQRFITHWNLTYDAMLALPGQGNPPKVSLNLRAAVGPTTASEIIKASGVPSDPQQLTEPPLETWVTDSVDKPNVDSVSPYEGVQQEAQANLAQVQVQKEQNAQVMAQELHAHNLRAAAAKADLAEKKAKAPLPKPAPKKKASK